MTESSNFSPYTVAKVNRLPQSDLNVTMFVVQSFRNDRQSWLSSVILESSICETKTVIPSNKETVDLCQIRKMRVIQCSRET
jgi:hypothetical protein